MVICNSHFTEGLVHEVAPGARTVVRNPAIDADRFWSDTSQQSAREAFGLPPDARVILTVARLVPSKGHETTLRAMAALPGAERAQLCHVIIGKGETEERLRSLVRDLGLEAQVRFAGFVADEDLPLWYRAADLFVLASVVDHDRRGMEGFGMAFTEAQAAALPVIGTSSGGIPDAVREGEGGWLIAERDADALAEHLQRLVAEPALFIEQGRLGRNRVRREMTWEAYAQKLIELV